jgi:hypothetical protein
MAPIQSMNKEDTFAQDMLRLQAKWPNLSMEQRLKEVQKVIDRFAEKDRMKYVPRAEVENLDPGVGAAYNHRTNRMSLNIQLFSSNKKSLSNDEVAQLAGDVRHELQHARDAREAANLIANEIAEGKYINTKTGKPIPLTKENIVLVSTARVNFEFPNGTKKLFRMSLSPEMAEQALKDYKGGRRLKLGSEERRYAGQIRDVYFTPVGFNQLLVENYILIETAKVYGTGSPKYRAAVDIHDSNPGEIRPTYEGKAMKQRVQLRQQGKVKENGQKGHPEASPASQLPMSLAVMQKFNEFQRSEVVKQTAIKIEKMLKEYGISQGDPEFKGAFLGAVKGLEGFSLTEKQDMCKIQKIDPKELLAEQAKHAGYAGLS